jgi:pyruvate kinase
MGLKIEEGRVIRGDGQPLRTKIVATLGRPASKDLTTTYKNGFFDLNGKKINPRKLSYRFFVDQFLSQGVDVLRLNLTHVPVANLKKVYAEVKEALLAWERKHKSHKRVAVLADLPGPKIRFDFQEEVAFKVGAPFTVRFTGEDPSTPGVVFVDQKPLKEAMDDYDSRWTALVDPDIENLPLFLEEPDAKLGRRRLAENVLGARCVEPNQPRKTFDAMMRSVRERLVAGEDVLVRIGDGEIVLKVNRTKFKVNVPCLPCTVFTAKEPSSKGRRGFTLKGIDLEIPSFTQEDRQLLDELLECEYSGCKEEGWEPVLGFVALSFAQTADDVLRLRHHMAGKIRSLGASSGELSDFAHPAVIAKIESQKGWENRRFILDVADGVMVARGDLGLQMEVEEVPAMQKRLTQMCNKRGKPVITATEMLKSMTDNVEPTRAEGSDVFNAILDGSDAVMMSTETSSGRYPLHAIRKMISVAAEAEYYFELEGLPKSKQSPGHRQRFDAFFLDADELTKQHSSRFNAIVGTLVNKWAGPLGQFCKKRATELNWRLGLYQTKQEKSAMQTTTDRITQATCTLGEQGGIKGILAATTSGRTARMLARLHPRTVIIGAAHDLLNTRKLIASYGVWPICIGRVTEEEGAEGMYRKCLECISQDANLDELLREGEIIFTAGTPVEKPGTTNLIQIKRYPDPSVQS